MSIELPKHYKETQISKPSAIGTGIANSAKTATNYIQADSTGIRIANANPSTATTYQHQTATNTEFVVDGVSRAEISGDGARFGKEYDPNSADNESHLKLDYHSLRLIDKEGSTYFHVSDLRDHDGFVEMTDYFTWDEDNPGCYLEFDPYSITTVTVNDVEVAYRLSGRVISFPDVSVATGDSIVVVYKTADIRTKAFTIGTRGEGTTGAYSYSEGYENVASARYSHSQGVFNTAGGREATAIGYGNVASGRRACVGGWGSQASGMASLAHGIGAVAEGVATTAIGVYPKKLASTNRTRFDYGLGWDYTVEHPEGYDYGYDPDVDVFDKYAFVIGNGTAENDRSNAIAVSWEGDIECYGDVTWRDFPLANTAKHYSSDKHLRYRKWGKMVNLVGAVSPKTAIPAGQDNYLVIGTLPAGCRPAAELVELHQGSGTTVWMLRIMTGGVVRAERYRSFTSGYIVMPTDAWLTFNTTFIVA